MSTFARLAAAISATAALLCSACAASTPTDATRNHSSTDTRSTVSSQRKTGTGQVRHDLEPLTKRFSALGTPVSATWQSGTLESDAPGPTTYWIDAVVTLEPDTAAALRATKPEPTTDRPDVPAEVAAAIPAGSLSRGTALDATFAQGSFRAKAYLVDGTDTVVLVALGE